MTNLRRGKPLTVEHLLHFVKRPQDMHLLLGDQDSAQFQIDQLGNVVDEKMPWEIASYAALAASRDFDAADRLAAWFRDLIDHSPAFANGATCGHAYLAVRMFADIPDKFLHLNVPAARQIMRNCRRSAKMKFYWHHDPKTKLTAYHRPYDL